MDELMAELDTTEWNAVLLNETWREKKEELWSTPSGHLFCGAGGTVGERGVGIILHKNIARGFRSFHAVSERLCAVDVDIDGVKARLICVYMPHSNYDNIFIEEVYIQLERLCSQANKLNRCIFIGGDWNAVVGQRMEGDVAATLGTFGHGERNARGQ